jgi:predicted nucleic acid-binding protein
MPAYLFDTNLLLYAHDQNEPFKQARALELIERLGNGLTAALSAQNLAEFANVALKRLTPPLSPAEVTEQLELLEQTFVVYPLTAAVVREAVRGVETHSLSYYDAQVWAVAKLNQVPVVLSEDFNVGATLEGVLFLNPLDLSFDLSVL